MLPIVNTATITIVKIEYRLKLNISIQYNIGMLPI